MANPIKIRLADMLDHDLFTPRELSWLSFNARVLQEAADKTMPLIARVRYLGIFSNNLDEFFRVRVAEVRRLISMSAGGDKQQFKDLLAAIQKKVVNLSAARAEVLSRAGGGQSFRRRDDDWMRNVFPGFN